MGFMMSLLNRRFPSESCFKEMSRLYSCGFGTCTIFGGKGWLEGGHTLAGRVLKLMTNDIAYNRASSLTR